MQSKSILCIVILALLLAFVCVPAYADTGGYVVRPLSHDEIGDYPGTDKQVSFWELPLLTQIIILSGSITALAVAFKVVPFFLFRRKKTLDTGNRDLIYRYIEDNPGCTVTDISRDRSMNAGSIRYHVERLDNDSRIVQMKSGKFTRLFRNSGAYSGRERTVIAAAKVGTNKSILLLIKKHPGLSNREIANRLGIKESMAHKYLSRLRDDRIVRCEKSGQHKLYYLDGEAEDILQKLDGQQSIQGCSNIV